jgi:biofilm PGA synthesis N-glycosyltransferase PgaC
MREPPYVTGGLSMLWGYLKAWARRETNQHGDAELRRFIRAYQRRALIVGRARAVAEIEARGAVRFAG